MDKKNFFVTLAAAALFAVPVSSQTIDVKEMLNHSLIIGVSELEQVVQMKVCVPDGWSI